MSHKRPSFRLIYRLFDDWHWHVNMTHRNTPPRTWTNRAGNSRWKFVARAKAWRAWIWLRLRVER